MNPKDIVALAKDIKRSWHTNDPYIIAERFGIAVLPRKNCCKGFTAHTIKMDGYPTVISINDAYTKSSQMVLCAHELGHALLHEGVVNHFAITTKNMAFDVEYEANLFAVALLMDDALESQLTIPLCEMNNYLLKSILNYNIRLK